jgi:hypothetical protein
MKRSALLLSGLVLLLATPHVFAEGEEAHCSALLAPSTLSLRDTGFDQPRAACGAKSISVGTRAFALIDTPDFYGSLSGSFFFDYHTRHESGFEFGIGARLIDYRFAQSAVFTADEVSGGPVYLEVLRPAKRNWFGYPAVLGHGLRVDVPYSNSSDDSFTLSASPSVMASVFLSTSMHLHGRVAALLWSVLPDSGADGRTALLASSDFSYAPHSRIGLLVGTELQGGWYGLGLDHLQARAGLRVRTGDSGAIELSAGTALAGSERADLVAWIGYRHIATPKTKKKRSRLKDWAAFAGTAR